MEYAAFIIVKWLSLLNWEKGALKERISTISSCYSFLFNTFNNIKWFEVKNYETPENKTENDLSEKYNCVKHLYSRNQWIWNVLHASEQ